MMMRARNAFSLVEMAIVLAILGLIVGGVLAGQAMLSNARLNSVITEYNGYNSAVNQFDTRFRALPGDMTNAETYWGSDASCPATPTNSVPKTATCNGNGDRSIGTHVSPYTDFTELYRAWQHLANAGLISGKFTGVAGSNFQDSNIGVNVPGSLFQGAGWSFYPLELGPAAVPTAYFANNYKNVLTFGKENSTNITVGSALSGPQAKLIDDKLDDGKPGYGLVSTVMDGAFGFDCITTDTQATAAYIITDDAPRCSLIFKIKVNKDGGV